MENLYPGPLDFNPAGQQISLVDFANPDFEKFPRFRKAMAAGQVANLEPGDALFIPSMWWHHMEGLGTFNVLVNYWWRNVPKFMGPAMNVLKHAMLSIRRSLGAHRRYTGSPTARLVDQSIESLISRTVLSPAY